MITTLRGHALGWFMKFCIVLAGNPQKTPDEIQLVMICEFRKPKSESQCVTEIKEIKQLPMESVWDFDQWFKTLMAKVCFQMLDVQHNEWFIVALLPHIQGPLMQQNIESKA